MMVDKACGCDPTAEVTKPNVPNDQVAAALMSVGDAAVRWRKAKKTNRKERERLLRSAVNELISLGW
jgi:hypothetical protein